jgi:hypothetical protein
VSDDTARLPPRRLLSRLVWQPFCFAAIERIDRAHDSAPSAGPHSRRALLRTAPLPSAAIAAFGYDGRRLRPNLVIGGVTGLDERTWPGRSLRIADTTIALADLRARCVMTTFDPDTLEQDHEVMQFIVDRFNGTMALNAQVASGGQIHVGDRVELLE